MILMAVMVMITMTFKPSRGLKNDNQGRARMTRLQKQVDTQEYQHVIHDMIHNI